MCRFPLVRVPAPTCCLPHRTLRVSHPLACQTRSRILFLRHIHTTTRCLLQEALSWTNPRISPRRNGSPGTTLPRCRSRAAPRLGTARTRTWQAISQAGQRTRWRAGRRPRADTATATATTGGRLMDTRSRARATARRWCGARACSRRTGLQGSVRFICGTTLSGCCIGE